jgi:hypothetical protein
VDKRILKCILDKPYVPVKTGFTCLRIRTSKPPVVKTPMTFRILEIFRFLPLVLARFRNKFPKEKYMESVRNCTVSTLYLK